MRIRKKSLIVTTIIILIPFLIWFSLYILNKGKSVEISSHIEVGEKVVIPSVKGNLIGSYFRPSESTKKEKFPAVVMVVGSGRSSHRTAWDPEEHHYFWKPVVEMLNENGYAALLIEKRGINGSEGHWENESIEDRAENIIATVNYLKNMDSIDTDRIGLMGHSQGGWVVQLAASKKPDDISFIVNLAGPSISVLDQILDDYSNELICKGLIGQEVTRKVNTRRKVLSSYKTLSKFVKTGYLSGIIDYEPDAVTRSLTVPIFSIYAENDTLVPPNHNIDSLTSGLNKAGNNKYSIHIVPNSNHHFFESDKCTSWIELKEKETSEQFLTTINKFIEWEGKLNLKSH